MANTVIVKGEFINNPSANNIGLAHFVHCVATAATQTVIVKEAGGTKGTKTTLAMEQESIQLAYTVGGATIGIADIDVTNSDYTSGKTETMTVVSLAIDF